MSQQHVLVLNCGSSSLKFAILNPHTATVVLSGLAECLGSDTARLSYRFNNIKTAINLAPKASHQQAIATLVDIIKRK